PAGREGRCPGRGMPCALAKGLLPGRGPPGRGPPSPRWGRPPPWPGLRAPGRGMPCELAKGLLPGRAAPGRGAGRSPPGFGATGFSLPGFGAGTAFWAFASAGADGAWGAEAACGAASLGCFAAGFIPGLGAPDVLEDAAGPLFFAEDLSLLLTGSSWRRRRATGASMVEEAERTNSPMSSSFFRTTLLGCPSSLASSWTRTLATFLLSRSGRQEGSDH